MLYLDLLCSSKYIQVQQATVSFLMDLYPCVVNRSWWVVWVSFGEEVPSWAEWYFLKLGNKLQPGYQVYTIYNLIKTIILQFCFNSSNRKILHLLDIRKKRYFFILLILLTVLLLFMLTRSLRGALAFCVRYALLLTYSDKRQNSASMMLLTTALLYCTSTLFMLVLLISIDHITIKQHNSSVNWYCGDATSSVCTCLFSCCLAMTFLWQLF